MVVVEEWGAVVGAGGGRTRLLASTVLCTSALGRPALLPPTPPTPTPMPMLLLPPATLPPMLQVKAEIQALSSFGFQYLSQQYLPLKLQEGDWI